MSALSLTGLAEARRQGRPLGIASICSAHPLVLGAAAAHARDSGATLLVEATCNQVNQYGGYTGLRPADFAAMARDIAQQAGLPRERLLLGGDHLGPNPWRAESAGEAMDKAEAMVAAYVEAGFCKIHLDASMGCAGEPAALDEETVAARAARLAAAAEAAALRAGGPLPLYVIGTEVPPPGGADHALDAIEPTDADAALRTIEIHRRVFHDAGLGDAFSRAVALVVQPGVEFGNENVVLYDREKAAGLARVLEAEPQFVFEAHSTDYQGRAPLRALVEDGFSILKVGPELTFCLREALYGLDLVASDMVAGYGERPLYATMERLMQAEPDAWRSHYAGAPAAVRVQRHYSYSDRIRYYWARLEAQAAVSRLFTALSGVPVPVTLCRQHLPRLAHLAGRPADPEGVVAAAVTACLDDYRFACAGGSAEAG